MGMMGKVRGQAGMMGKMGRKGAPGRCLGWAWSLGRGNFEGCVGCGFGIFSFEGMWGLMGFEGFRSFPVGCWIYEVAGMGGWPGVARCPGWDGGLEGSAWRLRFLAWGVFWKENSKLFLIFVCFVDLDPHFSVNNSDQFFRVFLSTVFEFRVTFLSLGSRFL